MLGANGVQSHPITYKCQLIRRQGKYSLGRKLRDRGRSGRDPPGYLLGVGGGSGRQLRALIDAAAPPPELTAQVGDAVITRIE